MRMRKIEIVHIFVLREIYLYDTKWLFQAHLAPSQPKNWQLTVKKWHFAWKFGTQRVNYNHCSKLRNRPVHSLTLYPLRQTAHFSKLANKDTLPVNNIPFESLRSTYLRIDISSYEGGNHFQTNCFKMQKWTTLKMHQNSIIVGIPLNYSLFSSS